MTIVMHCTLQQHLPLAVLKLNHCAIHIFCISRKLQQHLPFTVCVEGCEAAEEQRDDEVRTSQVPERSEGKTKVIRQQYLPFTVLKHTTAPYACSISYRLKHQQIVKALYLEGSFCMQNIYLFSYFDYEDKMIQYEYIL